MYPSRPAVVVAAMSRLSNDGAFRLPPVVLWVAELGVFSWQSSWFVMWTHIRVGFLSSGSCEEPPWRPAMVASADGAAVAASAVVPVAIRHQVGGWIHQLRYMCVWSFVAGN